MAWIETINDDDASGKLADLYEAAKRRAGRVFNILRIQSLNPTVLQSSMTIYIDIMRKGSPLSRAQREMLATVVSRANDCHY